MIKVNVSSVPGIDEWQHQLAGTEKNVRRAAIRALNKTARWSRFHIATEVANELEIKIGLIREGLRIVPAKASRPEFVVGLNPKSGVITSSKLGRPVQNRNGVRIGKRQFDHRFIATMPTGHRGVFKRKGEERLPIYELRIVATGKIRDAMDDLSQGRVMQHFTLVFNRELRYVMKTA